MLLNSKEKKIAYKLKSLLNKRGFIVDIKNSKNSKSIYLKLDNGACGAIRISDHINFNTKCKFNIIKNYKGKRTSYSKGKVRKYYNFNSYGIVIADVESERSNKIIKDGFSKYKLLRDKYKNSNKIAA